MMDVAHVEAGALAPQAAWSQRAQAPLVGQFSQWVGLIHELAELAAAKELTRRSHHRPNVDQGERGDLLRVADRHAFAHNPLHAQQTNTELVLD